MAVAYIDSAYFLDCISDKPTERKSAARLKPRLQTFKVVVPQVILGEVMMVAIRDYGQDLTKFKKKLDILSVELTALVDPRDCLPVLEKKHFIHLNHFMEKCGITSNDASLLSFVIDDAESDYLVTDDQNLSESGCVYEYENKLRMSGFRKRELKITDNP